MACRLFGAKPLSEPIVDYYQLDPWNKFSENGINTTIFMQENEPENVICKLVAILSGPGCVN